LLRAFCSRGMLPVSAWHLLPRHLALCRKVRTYDGAGRRALENRRVRNLYLCLIHSLRREERAYPCDGVCALGGGRFYLLHADSCPPRPYCLSATSSVRRRVTPFCSWRTCLLFSACAIGQARGGKAHTWRCMPVCCLSLCPLCCLHSSYMWAVFSRASLLTLYLRLF
jgi:hypothetical protein